MWEEKREEAVAGGPMGQQEEVVWGTGAVCRSYLGLLALVDVMEPLSRVSSGL